jgi:Protein of unknown function (DUF2786)
VSEPNETGQAKRSALLDKITALLAKTEQNGCTEAEAIAAAELAQKLMGKYGLSLSELQAISSPADVCEPDGITIGKRRAHEVLHLSNAIAFFTDCKSWYSTAGLIHLGKDRIRLHDTSAKSGCVVLVYFGLTADVAVAKYLTETLRNMLDTEWKAFWRAYPHTPKPSASKARASFMRAMTGRLSARLYEMKADQSQSETNDCRQIVLVKADIVQNAYNTAFGKPRIRRRSFAGQPSRSFDLASYNAGDAAGQRVSISSGALGA